MSRLNSFLLIIISTFSTLGISQGFLNGGYGSLGDFRSKNQNFSDSFAVIKRSVKSIKIWGGNDYLIESKDPLLTKKTIQDEVWGVMQNDTLYLNGMMLTGIGHFVKVEFIGRYSFMRAAYPIDRKVQKEYGLNDYRVSYAFGAIGGAIEGGYYCNKKNSYCL